MSLDPRFGCETLILFRSKRAFKLLSTIGLTRPPIIASANSTQGWRNLVVFVAGGGILPGYYAELRFDRGTYPQNPTVQPARKLKGRAEGDVLIADYRVYTQGKLLIPAAR